jgi:hypothetical protein
MTWLPSNNFETSLIRVFPYFKILRHSLKVSEWNAITELERGRRAVITALITGETRIAILIAETRAHAHDHQLTNVQRLHHLATTEILLSQAATTHHPDITIVIIITVPRTNIGIMIIKVDNLKLWSSCLLMHDPCQKRI